MAESRPTAEDLPRYPPAVRLGIFLGLAVLAVAISVPISIWWEERPLSEAEANLQVDKPLDCIKQVDEFLKGHPNHTRALGLKARALVKVGAMDAAIAIFNSNGAVDSDEWQAWALAHIAKQEWSLALPMLRQVLKEDAENSDAIEQITACLAMTHQYDEAIKMATRLSTTFGYEARGFVRLGMIERDRGRAAESIKYFTEALKLADEGEELGIEQHQIQLEIGKLFVQENQTEKAIVALRKSLAAADQVMTRRYLALALLREGRIEEAVAEWKAILGKDNFDSVARSELAKVALSQKKPNEALDWLVPIKSTARRVTDLAYLMQRSHQALGNTEESAEWRKRVEKLRERDIRNAKYEQVVSDAPQSFWGKIIRAWRLADQSNWAEAKQIMASFTGKIAKHPAVKKLNDSIAERAGLPKLEAIVDLNSSPEKE